MIILRNALKPLKGNQELKTSEVTVDHDSVLYCAISISLIRVVFDKNPYFFDLISGQSTKEGMN